MCRKAAPFRSPHDGYCPQPTDGFVLMETGLPFRRDEVRSEKSGGRRAAPPINHGSLANGCSTYSDPRPLLELDSAAQDHAATLRLRHLRRQQAFPQCGSEHRCGRPHHGLHWRFGRHCGVPGSAGMSSEGNFVSSSGNLHKDKCPIKKNGTLSMDNETFAENVSSCAERDLSLCKKCGCETRGEAVVL